MIHILMDDGELVAVLANVTTQDIEHAVVKVDEVFRKYMDAVPFEKLEQCMCEDLGISYSCTITFWTDVLVALLLDGGATRVEFERHECAPPMQPLELAELPEAERGDEHRCAECGEWDSECECEDPAASAGRTGKDAA